MKKQETLKTLVNEFVRQTLNADLNEGMRMAETATVCDGKQVPFGSPEHIKDLERTLQGLEIAKTHWDRGSSARYLIASACKRIRKMIEKLSAQQGTQQVKKDSSPEQ